MTATKSVPAQVRRAQAVDDRLDRIEHVLEVLVAAVEQHLAPRPGAPEPEPEPLGPPPPEPTFGLLTNSEGYRHAGDGRNLFP